MDINELAWSVLILIDDGWSKPSAIASACLNAGMVMNERLYDEIELAISAH